MRWKVLRIYAQNLSAISTKQVGAPAKPLFDNTSSLLCVHCFHHDSCLTSTFIGNLHAALKSNYLQINFSPIGRDHILSSSVFWLPSQKAHFQLSVAADILFTLSDYLKSLFIMPTCRDCCFFGRLDWACWWHHRLRHFLARCFKLVMM